MQSKYSGTFVFEENALWDALDIIDNGWIIHCITPKFSFQIIIKQFRICLY